MPTTFHANGFGKEWAHLQANRNLSGDWRSRPINMQGPRSLGTSWRTEVPINEPQAAAANGQDAKTVELEEPALPRRTSTSSGEPGAQPELACQPLKLAKQVFVAVLDTSFLKPISGSVTARQVEKAKHTVPVAILEPVHSNSAYSSKTTGTSSDDTPLKLFQQRVAKLSEARRPRVFEPTWSEAVACKATVPKQVKSVECVVPTRHMPSEMDSQDELFHTGGYRIHDLKEINLEV